MTKMKTATICRRLFHTVHSAQEKQDREARVILGECLSSALHGYQSRVSDVPETQATHVAALLEKEGFKVTRVSAGRPLARFHITWGG
jgi:hypothetical protein